MKTKNVKNAGTTLVELMVYMIVGLIVITATFKVLSKATNGYIHARAVSKAQYNARDGLVAMARDIASMGYKVYFTYSAASNQATLNIDSVGATRDQKVVGARYNRAGNNSAFFFTDGGSDENENDKRSDTLEFFRIRVNDRGERIAREWIKYFLDEDEKKVVRQLRELKKEPMSFDDSWEDYTETIIASNVVALNFRFSKDGSNSDGSWVSALDGEMNGKTNSVVSSETKRDQIQHIEAVILVKAHKSEKGKYAASQYVVGDRIYYTPSTDRGLVHRIYTQTVEVPNNARPIP